MKTSELILSNKNMKKNPASIRITEDRPAGQQEEYWSFFRVGDNFSYTQNNAKVYFHNCSSTVAISTSRNVVVENARDCLALIEGQDAIIEPLENISKLAESLGKFFDGKKVVYSIPDWVAKRENNLEITERALSSLIRKRYGLTVEKFERIQSGRSKRGIYVIDTGSRRYSLKYLSQDRKKAKAILKTARLAQEYFPRALESEEEQIILINGQLFSMIEFVEGDLRKRDASYFKELGEHMARLNSLFLRAADVDFRLSQDLAESCNQFSKSNLLANYIDLIGEKNGSVLLPELQSLLDCEFESLPRSIVHTDMNQSNLIWNDNRPVIIDLEGISCNRRISQFVAPVIFRGNMQAPDYISGSLEQIIEGYQRLTETPISKEELLLIKNLVKIAVLRNYVVRRIRRDMSTPDVGSTKEILRRINE